MSQTNDEFLGLDHVQVAAPAGGEPEARRFYGELLGLRELPKPPDLAKRGGAWFELGAHQIHIGVEADFKAAKKAHPALMLRDEAALDALWERLSKAGVEVKKDGDRVEGVKRFFAFDPFGNRLELLCRV